MNKMVYGVVALVIVLILVGSYWMGSQQMYSPAAVPNSGSGRFVVALTDAAVNMQGVQKINLTIDSVRVHSSANGWETISDDVRKNDLLELNSSGSAVLLADVDLSAGNYDQIELGMQSVEVVDSSGSASAAVPSKRMSIGINSTLDANSTNTVKLDVLASESLHRSGSGEYVFAPVVNVEARNNATVSSNNDNSIEISGGSVTTQVKVGMDATGAVGVGVQIPASADVMIDASGLITVGSSGNTSTGSGSASGSGSVDVNAGGLGVGIGASDAVTYNVNIQGYAFAQQELHIKQGDTVVWTNMDSVSHTVTSDSGTELDSAYLSTDQTYSHTFNTKGTYSYHCTPHPNMKATVVVE